MDQLVLVKVYSISSSDVGMDLLVLVKVYSISSSDVVGIYWYWLKFTTSAHQMLYGSIGTGYSLQHQLIRCCMDLLVLDKVYSIRSPDVVWTYWYWIRFAASAHQMLVWTYWYWIKFTASAHQMLYGPIGTG